MIDKSGKTIFFIGLTFLGLFVLLFSLGAYKVPLPGGLKTVKLAFLDPPPPKKYFTGKVPVAKVEIPLWDYASVGWILDTTAQDTAARDTVVRDTTPPKAEPMYYLPRRPVDCSDSCLPKILLLGDSQLEGLRRPVYNYCVANGYDLVASVVWYGSSTKQWGSTDTLQHFIRMFEPKHVIFAIGLNELFVNDFDNRRTYIDEIMATFDREGVGYTWIGPAAWKKDKGVIDIMREKVGRNFFASEKLTLARAKDGMHPSNDAARIWMDSVAVFMRNTTDIRFELKPEKDPKYAYSPFILLEQPKN